jgi:hypothetical protein
LKEEVEELGEKVGNSLAFFHSLSCRSLRRRERNKLWASELWRLRMRLEPRRRKKISYGEPGLGKRQLPRACCVKKIAFFFSGLVVKALSFLFSFKPPVNPSIKPSLNLINLDFVGTRNFLRSVFYGKSVSCPY